MKKAIYPVLLVIFTVLLTSITSSQATPAQSTYYACVKKSSGAIKMTTSAKKCAKGYAKISWNSNGPQGPSGITGIEGEPGADGQDGGYEVMLNPTDFTTYSFSTLSSLEQVYESSLPRSAWVIENANTGVETLLASFPAPSSWATATSAKITVYWYAENSSGNVILESWGDGKSEGSSLDHLSGTVGKMYQSTPLTKTLISSEKTFPINPGSEMIDVTIMRWMNSALDTNTGKIYILAAKVEPVLE